MNLVPGSHNIGIAMATPHGLVVPIIKSCESRSIAEVSNAASILAYVCPQPFAFGVCPIVFCFTCFVIDPAISSAIHPRRSCHPLRCFVCGASLFRLRWVSPGLSCTGLCRCHTYTEVTLSLQLYSEYSIGTNP